MDNTLPQEIYKIAIIGLGPRGLSALEQLIFNALKNDVLKHIEVYLFEKTGHWGSGHVYDTKQPDSNWLNIPERSLEIAERPAVEKSYLTLKAFPSYHEWCQINQSEHDTDFFPPRSKIGRYLSERFMTLYDKLEEHEIAKKIASEVIEIKKGSESFEAICHDNTGYDLQEILLTIGHQPIHLSEQLKSWKKFADSKDHLDLFVHAYPMAQYFDKSKSLINQTIGIRGFGLSMIDIVRGILEHLGGSFSQDLNNLNKLLFIPSTSMPKEFVVFSLDGLPLAPKPLNESIDNLFKPNSENLHLLSETLKNPHLQRQAKDMSFLIDTMSFIISDVFEKITSITQTALVISEWLKDDSFENDLIVSKNQTANRSMEQFTMMASGTCHPSLDYCIGQVWKHCQPIIYDALSYNQCSPEITAQIIELDERMKRYAFGPPVESTKQLLALIDYGILNTELVNNPNIQTNDYGWKLTKEEQSCTCTVMINSVLDSPKIEEVNTSLVEKLLKDDVIHPVYNNLGVDTLSNGLIKNQDYQSESRISLLGRLAIGTVIGVDSLNECFGKRPELWAHGTIERIKKATIH